MEPEQTETTELSPEFVEALPNVPNVDLMLCGLWVVGADRSISSDMERFRIAVLHEIRRRGLTRAWTQLSNRMKSGELPVPNEIPPPPEWVELYENAGGRRR